VIGSVDDLIPAPPRELLDLLLEAASSAREIDLAALKPRCQKDTDFALLTCWPGEHYRLLAGLVATLQPRLVVEIGTFTGWGALSLAEELQADGRVVTYDLVPWTSFPKTLLTQADFNDRFEQRIADLSDPAVFSRELEILASADLIFVDGPSDSVLPRLCDLLCTLDTEPVIVFDDIRFLSRVQFWRQLSWPRLDATSLGHWSGTGIAKLPKR
jgi:predicted O-methyltransferase YrrM